MTKKDLPSPAPTGGDPVKSFLQEVARTPPPKPGGGRARLIFAMDATASREPTWLTPPDSSVTAPTVTTVSPDRARRGSSMKYEPTYTDRHSAGPAPMIAASPTPSTGSPGQPSKCATASGPVQTPRNSRTSSSSFR